MKCVTKVILLTVVMTLFLVGCGKQETDMLSGEDDQPAAITNEKDENSTEEKGNLKEVEALGEVKVEKELFDVELTIPADFAGDVTQESLNQSVSEKGWKSATLNADGSVTYVMTKSQHKEMMKEIKKTLDDSINEMCGSEDYSSFVSIKTNSDYTNFEITTTSEELDLMESFSVMAFYMYGGMYNIFNGTSVDNIHVDFINETTGKIISSANSKDMGNE